ncbi:hypothetical protein [Oceanobacillus bengalensis]|uniref:hypothetical protein n=1 Tax=Oceanobacillus bengalensis TaxID=1435466 RepID=UPI001FE4FB56|nr:hypothetical protein [Oceanobacillus bengalensis]
MSARNLEHTLSSSYPKIRMISDSIGNMIGFLVLGVLFGLDFNLNGQHGFFGF